MKKLLSVIIAVSFFYTSLFAMNSKKAKNRAKRQAFISVPAQALVSTLTPQKIRKSLLVVIAELAEHKGIRLRNQSQKIKALCDSLSQTLNALEILDLGEVNESVHGIIDEMKNNLIIAGDSLSLEDRCGFMLGAAQGLLAFAWGDDLKIDEVLPLIDLDQKSHFVSTKIDNPQEINELQEWFSGFNLDIELPKVKSTATRHESSSDKSPQFKEFKSKKDLSSRVVGKYNFNLKSSDPRATPYLLSQELPVGSEHFYDAQNEIPLDILNAGGPLFYNQGNCLQLTALTIVCVMFVLTLLHELYANELDIS
jgi:hypothetical protein